MSPARAVLCIHGGAGLRPAPERLEALRSQLRAVSHRAARFLQRHSALETVVYAVRLLEDDPLFNAGTGSYLQRDGAARMSASVMDGTRHRFAAVLNIERVRHPILIAQRLLREPDRVLAGREATRFAQAHGAREWNPITPERRRQWRTRRRMKHGTVGAVARDRAGRLAAATSTGGKGFEQPGRVSDTGMPVGNYATSMVAISCTGIGEDILEEGLGVRLAQRVMDGMPLARAFAATHREVRRRHRQLGAIGVDARGRLAWFTTCPMLYAIAQTSTERLESF